MQEVLTLGDAWSTSLGADDAGGDREFQSEGAADGEHPIADLHRVAVAEAQGLQPTGSFDSHNRHVGLRVALDLSGNELAAVVQLNDHFLSVLHHVVVGQDDSALVDDRSGSHALGAARIGATGAILLVATTEEVAESLGHLGMLVEELLGFLASYLGTSLLLGSQHDNRRQNPFGDRAEDIRQFGDCGCMGYGRGCGGGFGLRLNGCLLSETDGGHQSDSADQRDQPGCTVAKQCHGEAPFGIETGLAS